MRASAVLPVELAHHVGRGVERPGEDLDIRIEGTGGVHGALPPLGRGEGSVRAGSHRPYQVSTECGGAGTPPAGGFDALIASRALPCGVVTRSTIPQTRPRRARSRRRRGGRRGAVRRRRVPGRQRQDRARPVLRAGHAVDLDLHRQPRRRLAVRADPQRPEELRPGLVGERQPDRLRLLPDDQQLQHLHRARRRHAASRGSPTTRTSRSSRAGRRTATRWCSCGSSGGNMDLYVKHLGSGVVTRLTDSPAFDEFGEFSPDGTEVAFGSNRLGQLRHLDQERHHRRADPGDHRSARRLVSRRGRRTARSSRSRARAAATSTSGSRTCRPARRRRSRDRASASATRPGRRTARGSPSRARPTATPTCGSPTSAPTR